MASAAAADDAAAGSTNDAAAVASASAASAIPFAVPEFVAEPPMAWTADGKEDAFLLVYELTSPHSAQWIYVVGVENGNRQAVDSK